MLSNGLQDDTWTVEVFAASLGIESAVSKALLDGTSMPAGGEFELLESLAGRTTEIEEKLRARRLVQRVAAMLSEGAKELTNATDLTAAELNNKFIASGDAFMGEDYGGNVEFFGGAPHPVP